MLPTHRLLLVLLLFATKYFEAHLDFSIDYTNRTFRLDGQPYRYISGEVHYFRIRPEQWEDRLSKIRAAGLNAIQTYIPWNFHEHFEREYNFVGDRDIIHFLDLAAAQNLSVLLRIGPYICAEWENGGLPWWLLKYSTITLRSSNPNFIKEVHRWWNVLLPRFVPYLRHNGGPIIMIQLENEYGSYGCDRSYMQQLRDISRSLLGNDTVLFTTDAATLLLCGHIDGTFATIDFGSLKSIATAESFFHQQNLYNNDGGPNVNSEYYPGWFSTWGAPEPYHSNTEEIARMFNMLLSMNASFNYYMFHGGTNFGFWNGAESYAAVTTSYDYFAPLTESGDITDAYITIHDLIANITDWPNRPIEQLPLPNRIGSVLSLYDSASTAARCFIFTRPLTFEQINFPYGYVIYSTTIPRGSVLDGSNIRDFGHVFIDGTYQGVISPNYMPSARSKLRLKFVENGSILKIIVENRGRQTYPTINDPKGIVGDIFIDGVALRNWTMCGVDLELLQRSWRHLNDENKSMFQPGDIFVGEFTTSEIADTYLQPLDWGKGVAFINNFNIGKYWPSAGPQVTLYVPKPLLNMTNMVMLIEFESIPIKCATNLQKCRIRFVDKSMYKTHNKRINSLLRK